MEVLEVLLELMAVHTGPFDCGPLGPPCSSSPSGPQCSPGFCFMQTCGTALDQRIADMNRSVLQLLTAQQATNPKLQLKSKQSQAVQMAYTNALGT